ncbi:Zinc finger BED domain-containing protein DAYSLEEPER [Rhynchospora pubera]|uniref:Zinc finger BED domain-containing protein DAYSLEEPER n=1 Tax=Rhynchospora pubera TaxID=906938 RepID=A0AAV8GDJ7_9POAL|nr:Zinc finger BED domain-containing protein DAYSLEEPER [Rhynchospora pubera]
MGAGLHFETQEEIERIQKDAPNDPNTDPNNPNTTGQDGEKEPPCEEEGANPKKRKTRKVTAKVWQYFNKGPVDEEGSYSAICKYCGAKYLQGQQRGTASMKNHIDKGCKKFPRNRRDALQKMLQAAKSAEGTELIPWVFDQMKCRKALAMLVIAHEYPFNCVNHYYLRLLFNELQPSFKIPSRMTLRSDCIKFYEEQHVTLYEQLGQLTCRFSFTSDLWTNKGRDRGFMAISCHYIDEKWILRKRIITFVPLPSPHTGKHIAEAFYEKLVLWNLDKRALCLVLDNASSNDACINELFAKTPIQDDLPVDGQVFHQRCGCHILNLIVQDGLSVLKDEIRDIRDTMKYIKHSQGRMEKFKLACSQSQIPFKKPAWDVPTRWNSTYLMLVLALELKPALCRYSNLDKRYYLKPAEFKWDAVECLVSYLKVFYEATLKLSGTKYPTLNLFFPEFAEVYLSIKRMSSSPFPFIVQMGAEMTDKFDKYWSIGNSLLAIACVLDPRCKLYVVEYYMKELFPEECDNFIANLRECMKALFNDYVEENASDENRARVSKRKKTIVVAGASASGSATNSRAALKDYIKERKNSEPPKSELEDYLATEVDEATVDEDFDILAWWRLKSPKYPILSQLTKDILAVPISTVASESAFSTSGRILSPARSSLNDESIEALLCAQDWLRASINEKGEKIGEPLWTIDEGGSIED